MTRNVHLEDVFEPERYELAAPAAYHFAADRREFFKILGAGLAIFCSMQNAQAAEKSVKECIS